MISLFLTTSYVLLRIRHTISLPELSYDFNPLERNSTQDWRDALTQTFNYDYLVDFMLPVTSLCLTLLSIMVELQQVINMCLDMDDED
jgi:hypothetical protein